MQSSARFFRVFINLFLNNIKFHGQTLRSYIILYKALKKFSGIFAEYCNLQTPLHTPARSPQGLTFRRWRTFRIPDSSDRFFRTLN